LQEQERIQFFASNYKQAALQSDKKSRSLGL